jgi:predicted membrane channel-forming protein YqfA (hemolysin III family)
MIAASYTPFGLLVLSGDWRIVVLAIVWAGATVAILTRLLWARPPRWLPLLIGGALGWVGVVVFPQLITKTGLLAAMLVLAGGLCYTLGGVVYARRRPERVRVPRAVSCTRRRSGRAAVHGCRHLHHSDLSRLRTEPANEEKVVSVRFEEMTVAQVHARAANEKGVQRGKPLYADRAWTQVHDEMLDNGAKAVGDLPRRRVRELRAAIKAQSRP